MTMLASQITSLAVVYSIVYSGVDQRKHQSSASLAFVRDIHRGPVNFPQKWPVTRKIFPFDDVIMCFQNMYMYETVRMSTAVCVFRLWDCLNTVSETGSSVRLVSLIKPILLTLHYPNRCIHRLIIFLVDTCPYDVILQLYGIMVPLIRFQYVSYKLVCGMHNYFLFSFWNTFHAFNQTH